MDGNAEHRLDETPVNPARRRARLATRGDTAGLGRIDRVIRPSAAAVAPRIRGSPAVAGRHDANRASLLAVVTTMTCSMDDLLLAKQRMDNSARRVWRAQRMLARMVENGEPTEEAEAHLGTLQASLRRNRAAYAELLDRQRSGARAPRRMSMLRPDDRASRPPGEVIRLPFRRPRVCLRLVAANE